MSISESLGFHNREVTAELHSVGDITQRTYEGIVCFMQNASLENTKKMLSFPISFSHYALKFFFFPFQSLKQKMTTINQKTQSGQRNNSKFLYSPKSALLSIPTPRPHFLAALGTD